MTSRIGITKVKRNWERVIAKVESGDEIIVCRWGKPAARLIRFPASTGRKTKTRTRKRSSTSRK